MHAPIAMTTPTCVYVNCGNQKSILVKELATRGIATTRSLVLAWSLAVLRCARQKSTPTLKMLWSGVGAVALAVTNPKILVQTVSKILINVLQSGVEAKRRAGQRGRRACALATMAKREAEHGCKTCLSAAQKSAAQCRAPMRLVSQSVQTPVARPQIRTVAIAMTILTGVCKSTRTATSGLARKPEMLAIVPQDMVRTGSNVARL